MGGDECRDISLGIYGRWLHALQGKKIILTFQKIRYVWKVSETWAHDLFQTR